MPPEQTHPQLLLQLADLHAQRRLGDIQLLGSAGDVAGLDDAGKVLKLTKVDGFSPESVVN
jgi:hypothetical protein